MISGPFLFWSVGWRWLRNDGSWTAFGHTPGHTKHDANVYLSGPRCATRLLVVHRENCVYLVPFVEDEHTVFLKTIIPSRKATKQ